MAQHNLPCGVPLITMDVKFYPQRDPLHRPGGTIDFDCPCGMVSVQKTFPTCHSALPMWTCANCGFVLPSSTFAIMIARANKERVGRLKSLAAMQ